MTAATVWSYLGIIDKSTADGIWKSQTRRRTYVTLGYYNAHGWVLWQKPQQPEESIMLSAALVGSMQE